LEGVGSSQERVAPEARLPGEPGGVADDGSGGSSSSSQMAVKVKIGIE
jgi:hypothetical protein